MTADQVAALEQSVNDKIRARIPLVVRHLAEDDAEGDGVSEGPGRGGEGGGYPSHL